jgi:hypothetical protein
MFCTQFLNKLKFKIGLVAKQNIFEKKKIEMFVEKNIFRKRFHQILQEMGCTFFRFWGYEMFKKI